MATSTDAMYNSSSRYIHEKFIIHFSTDKTLEVLRSNYLMQSNILEETHKVTESPFGDVSSNELELSLINIDGRFNPKNTDGPYYGLIRKGVKIEAFIRPDEVDEWDPLGIFYVKDWSTSSTGTTAEVVANDILYTILNSPVPSLAVVRDVPFRQYITEYFALFGVTVTVDESINLVLPYGFTSGYTDNRRLLADLMMAAMADCFCKHDGGIVIQSKTSPRTLRATITDDDQIIQAAIKQSLATDYDSASITYNIMQESAEQNILSISDVTLTPGITNTELTKFSTGRVLSVRSIKTESDVAVKPVGFVATADSIVCSLQSTSNTTAQLDILGTTLESVSSVLSTEGSSAIELDNVFIQTQDRARLIVDYVDAYVNDAAPTLDLTVRGNPRLELGDLIQAKSDRYKVDYVGILTQVKQKYSGGLSCDITLTAISV